jgi:hypothetical protein
MIKLGSRGCWRKVMGDQIDLNRPEKGLREVFSWTGDLTGRERDRVEEGGEGIEEKKVQNGPEARMEWKH